MWEKKEKWDSVGNVLYTGESDASMDDKGRLTIPKKFRSQFPSGPDGEIELWVVPGERGAAFQIMDTNEGRKWVESATALSDSNPFLLEMLARCERVEVDKVGRILLSSKQLEGLDLAGKREFSVTGRGNALNVWSREDRVRAEEEFSEESASKAHRQVREAVKIQEQAEAMRPTRSSYQQDW